MNRIYIWGEGGYAEYVYSIIDRASCAIMGIIDSDKRKQGKLWNRELKIHAPEELESLEYEWIIISVMKYEAIESECRERNIPKEKIISYWKDSESCGLFENRAMRILKEQREKEIFKNRLDSAPYEWGLKSVPMIRPAEELLRKIKSDKSSLCRFGDGEFNIMCGSRQPWFQKGSESLRERLIEVIGSSVPNINLAVAQNFSHLEQYKEEAADEIRAYMSHGTRDAILKFLEQNHIYYDAYVTRPYIIYKGKENAEKLFPLMKEIWYKRDVILVEGKYARIGINNDLFDAAKSVKRIICPHKDAWDCYNKIKRCIMQSANKETLICISLGPTATVLAYDLAKEGFQALDVGQVDNEYDWYLQGVTQRIAIPGKMVAEIAENANISTFSNIEYQLQIIARIS